MKIVTGALALGLAASGAVADGFTYKSGTFSFSGMTRSGRPYAGIEANGGLEYKMGNFFVVGKLGYGSRQIGSSMYQRNAVSIDMGYQITPNMLAHVGYTGGAYRRFNRVRPFEYYRVGAQAEFGPATLAFTASQRANVSPDLQYQIAGEYTLNNGLTLGVNHIGTNSGSEARTGAYALYDTAQLDLRALVNVNYDMQRGQVYSTELGIDGSYEFGGSYRATAAYSVRMQNSGSTMGTTTVGLGYKIADNVWLDGQVGQFVHTTRYTPTLSLKLSYEMGRKTLLVDRVNDLRADMIAAQSGIFGAANRPLIRAGVHDF